MPSICFIDICEFNKTFQVGFINFVAQQGFEPYQRMLTTNKEHNGKNGICMFRHIPYNETKSIRERL